MSLAVVTRVFSYRVAAQAGDGVEHTRIQHRCNVVVFFSEHAVFETIAFGEQSVDLALRGVRGRPHGQPHGEDYGLQWKRDMPYTPCLHGFGRGLHGHMDDLRDLHTADVDSGNTFLRYPVLQDTANCSLAQCGTCMAPC